jgi:hypothetical protein
MNFLQLCQKVARDAGTVDNGAGENPVTVIGQTGYLAKIVDWTNQAYREIQNAHRQWKWMQGEFYGDLTIGVDRYAGTYFTDFDTALAIDRFSQWGIKGDSSDASVSMYATAIGVSGEGRLRFREWNLFRETLLRGDPSPGPPQVYSVDNQNRIVFGPAPDAVYTVRGLYRKSAQTLILDADIPEMPLDFHDLIVDLALILLGTHDEAPTLNVQQMRSRPKFSMLEAQQLPTITWGAPLA